MKYLDGTTDITRTVHFGKPSEHERACYTAVGACNASYGHMFCLEIEFAISLIPTSSSKISVSLLLRPFTLVFILHEVN